MKPRIAIVDPNTLAALGLRALLIDVAPMAEVCVFGSYAELSANRPEAFIHYFVATETVLRHRDFFQSQLHKTIVLTLSTDAAQQLGGFHCLCVNVGEQQLVRSLLALEKSAHRGRRLMPPIAPRNAASLSAREIEVMVLIVQGLINKQIAERLGIGLATVITHRKNIMDKLNVRSVSALTIYAVMNGYVDINSI